MELTEQWYQNELMSILACYDDDLVAQEKAFEQLDEAFEIKKGVLLEGSSWLEGMKSKVMSFFREKQVEVFQEAEAMFIDTASIKDKLVQAKTMVNLRTKEIDGDGLGEGIGTVLLAPFQIFAAIPKYVWDWWVGFLKEGIPRWMGDRLWSAFFASTYSPSFDEEVARRKFDSLYYLVFTLAFILVLFKGATLPVIGPMVRFLLQMAEQLFALVGII